MEKALPHRGYEIRYHDPAPASGPYQAWVTSADPPLALSLDEEPHLLESPESIEHAIKLATKYIDGLFPEAATPSR